MRGLCRCPHSAKAHTNGRGRCRVSGCTCLFPPIARATKADPAPRPLVTAEADGIVRSVQRAAIERIVRQSDREKLEHLLYRNIELAGLPVPVRQFHWARPERMYRSDFAYPEQRLIVECDGGIWMAGGVGQCHLCGGPVDARGRAVRAGGGHSHPMHLEAQHERDNLATVLGWRLLRFTDKPIKSGLAVETIRRALQPAEMRV